MTSDNLHTSSADFEMVVEGLEASDIRVLSFEGREEMNGLYRFDVRFRWLGSDDGDIEDFLLHNSARLLLEPAGPVGIEGIVTEVEMDAVHAQGGALGRLRIQPRMSRLCLRRNSRVFQDRTVVEIACSILDAHRVFYDPRKLSRPYTKRAYCVQYQETDYDFVVRLLAEEGILFFFLHPALGARDPLGKEPRPHGSARPEERLYAESLVLIDDAADYWEILGGARLCYAARRDAPSEYGGLWIDAFERRRRVGPESLSLSAYSYLQPAYRDPLTSWDPSDIGGAVRWDRQIFEHHVEYEIPDVVRNVAPSQLEQHRASLDVATGRTCCRFVTPGRVFRLEGHPQAHLDGDYVPIAVRHEGYSSWARPRDKDTYTATFDCVPASVPFRPPRPEKRPREVLLTGEVVGAAGQEIATDELGRVRVRFHWEAAAENPSGSCFLRVAAAWAGAGFGMQWTPRVGAEVLIGFIAGDLDSPVVVGCLHNNAHRPPFPAGGRKNGIRTCSTPGGTSYNEISFDDSAGAEVIQITAAGDLRTDVRGDRTSDVKHDDTLVVAGSSSTTVAGDMRAGIAGDHVVRVEKNDFHVVAGDRADTTFGDADTLIHKDARTRIAGDETRHVAGSSDVEIAGHQETRALDGLTTIVAGSRPSLHELHVDGQSRTTASEGYRVSAGTEMVFTCGKSRIRLSPDAIELISPEIRLRGPSAEVVLREGTLDLRARDQVSLKAAKTMVRGSRASVELGRDARIDGAKIKMNCAREPEDEGFPPDDGVVTHIALEDQRGRPLAHRHFTVLSGGEPVEGGILGKDGAADVVLREGDQIVFSDMAGVRRI